MKFIVFRAFFTMMITIILVAFMVTVMGNKVSAVSDSQSPTIPKGLVVTNITYRSISFCWRASSDNIKVKGYQIFRDGKKIMTISKTSYTNTDLIPGRKYTYTIKAYDAAGNSSEISAALSISTTSDTQSPATPLNLNVACAKYTSIALKWDCSTDNTSVKGYEIYCNYKKIASTSSTLYECKRLIPGITYTFTVRAYDIANNYSLQSDNIFYSTLADFEAPSIPTGLAATSVKESNVNLVWLPSYDNVKVREYEIYCDGTKVGTSSKTYYSYKKLIPGTNYTFSIKAVDSVGNSSISSSPLKITSVKDLQAPTTPGNLHIVSHTQSSVSLAWNSSTDNVEVKGYKIYCNSVEVKSTTSTHCTLKCPKSGLFVYCVKSFDLVNNMSSSSNNVSIVKI